MFGLTFEQVRWANMVLTGVGAAVFTVLLAYITLAPEDFDQRTRDFAVVQVRSEVDATLSTAAQSDAADALSEWAGKVSERLQKRIDDMRAALDAGLDQFIADILAAACQLDCERREEARQAVRDYYEDKIERYGVALDRIERVVADKYEDVMDELRTDLAIFSGSNGVALAFAFGLAVFRKRAARHLLPISLALTAATLLAIVWYVFGQDWVMTIIFNDYWGWGYAALLAVQAGLLMDIAVNKARVTSEVFNAIGGMFGAAGDFSPC